jgi:hypothetical protein
MDWRRILLWAAFIAILVVAILVFIRVAKVAFQSHRADAALVGICRHMT